MAIVPDDKDWTWVLAKACPECGFDGPATGFEQVPGLVREAAARFAVVLERPGVAVRPDDATWSPLEYAAHVRDVCRIFTHRLDIASAGTAAAPGPVIPAYDRTVTVDESGVPMFANWDQDATADAARYGTQDPAIVAAELAAAVETASRAYESVPPSARSRAARRSNGSDFTIDSMSRYFAHDLVHHLHDVRA
ncbi:DinB family protein [Nocardia blacklockiae]|uniref:DinB family protein n=1 Tax=Nocardia blacklockiae TaxID=480036 RepID=UPI0018945CCD|nr:DinB family protein [Nocardia blacklockiae]MBF6175274.1 DinB family protein [Nocardia blacklockiae]